MSSEIISRNILNSSNISRKDYTASLLEEGIRVGIANEFQADVLKQSMMSALAEVIGYFTENKSSSIKVDTARSLSKSMIYNIDTYLLSLSDHEKALSILLDRKPIEMYGKGFLINKKHFEEARVLYGKVMFSRLSNGSEEYNKTLDKYFRYYLSKYDARFTADLKIYLSLYQYDITGEYHIDEAVSVLKKLLDINAGRKSDIILDDSH